MQVVAFHVADQLAVEVELVQVAAAVVQVVEVLAGGQRQRGQVAQGVVFVGQGALRRGLLDQAAQQVVGKFQRFFADTEFFALGGGQALDGEQAVCVVVGVVLTGIGVELGQQAADAIALEYGMALWPFAPLAVADFVDLGQMPAQVVAEATGHLHYKGERFHLSLYPKLSFFLIFHSPPLRTMKICDVTSNPTVCWI